MRKFQSAFEATSSIFRRATPKWPGQDRFISINSAIHRGIRKSNSRERTRGASHDGRRSRDSFPSQKLRKAPRTPRPNHQERQDFEDVAELRRRNEAKKTVKQQLYREGGRARPLKNGKDTYKAAQTGTEPDTPRRYPASTRKPLGSLKPSHSIRPNRAVPRAEIFGPGGTRLPNLTKQDDIEHNSYLDSAYETSGGMRKNTFPLESAALESSGRLSLRHKGTNTGHYDRVSRVPLAIPYTTPASEFLYGASVVSAALRFSARKFYKFYSYDGPDRVDRRQDESMRGLARSKAVEIMQVQGDWLKLLDKMSKGRPHNGYVLEASPLPKLPVRSLPEMIQPQEIFHVNLDHQSREEELINGTERIVRYTGGLVRYPIILMLDGILDPGNLGALLRTAYFFGVDAVAISTRNCAPLSPVALKSSAGASESLPLLSVNQPQSFVQESQKNGWKFYAAVAPGEPFEGRKQQRYISVSALACPAAHNPCVLMIGAEGDGLRPNLRKKANFDIGVEGQRLGQGGIDSLNVSVAAGVLCQAFLKEPATRKSFSDSVCPQGSPRDHVDTGKASQVAMRSDIQQSTDSNPKPEMENRLF